MRKSREIIDLLPFHNSVIGRYANSHDAPLMVRREMNCLSDRLHHGERRSVQFTLDWWRFGTFELGCLRFLFLQFPLIPNYVAIGIDTFDD